ncbi:MAG TPA: hypothetical protein VG122_08820 [Gemmata sp.]|jgi:hypothetical protein|nr:hypothetical protein [Gemmata sp.]
MRILTCIAAFSIIATLAALCAPAADEPGPLLKPIVPSSSNVRVRIPVIEERGTTMQFKAQVPKGKSKKGETIDVAVGIENLPGPSFVSSKLWQSWGYEIPPNKIAVLPELILLGTQVAPKTSKHDVQVKMAMIQLEIIEPPGGAEKVRGCDIYMTLKDLTKYADRTFETRLYFQDKFLELTVPSGTVKRPGTGDDVPPDPAISADRELVVVAGPMANRKGLPQFAYASINGLTQYKTPDGKIELVNAGVSSTNDWPTGVLITSGTARGCGVEIEQGSDIKGMGATFEAMIAKGKVKELRLGIMTGPGLKTQKDIVIQDLTVWIDKSNSGHFVWLGPQFLSTYLKDHIFACGSDGMWQLYGRLKPDLLQDIKTRPKK